MTSIERPPASRLVTAEVVAALVFGLIPIAGILLWGWSPFALIFLYWIENVLIGVRTIATMTTSGVLYTPATAAGAAALSAFFALHYGLFCLVHGSFIVALFGNNAYTNDPANLIAVATQMFAKQPNFAFGVGSIALWQIVEFVVFLVREASVVHEVTIRSLREMMMAPYPRIVLLHITIILGGFLLAATGWPVLGVLALAVFKMGYDIACTLGWSPLRIARTLMTEERT